MYVKRLLDFIDDALFVALYRAVIAAGDVPDALGLLSLMDWHAISYGYNNAADRVEKIEQATTPAA